MVFCGRPSRGCHGCREKKTRCDKIPLPDGCGQCAKAKRKCPGYRVLGEVMFRDESTSVIRKFKVKEARAKQLASKSFTPALMSGEGSDTGSEESLVIVQKQLQQPSLWHTLMPTIEERAIGFFVTNYVLSLRGPSRGHLDYIPELYKTERVGKCLAASMTAVGLASYSHATRAPSLMNAARWQYVKAIQLTNEALRSPEDVKKDSTLMAIMILGIFEAVSGSKQVSLKNWAGHVNGAAAVIKLRGREQLYRPASRRMLVQVTSSLSISCIQRGVALPDFICKLMAEASKIIQTPDPSFIVQETMIAYASFRASILDGSCSDPEVIIARALQLDSVLLEIFVNVPPGWEYETVFTDVDSDITYNGRYHIYYDYWIAQIWNAMRVLRVLLNENIRDTLLKGFSSKPPLFNQPEHTAQFQISTDLLYELQADILATIPQHLGFVSRSTPLFQSKASLDNDLSLSKFFWTKFKDYPDDIQSMRMSGGYFLVWPLWFAGVMDIATEPIRQFVIKNLKSIGLNMGIQQALMLAATIESRTEIDAWKTD